MAPWFVSNILEDEKRVEYGFIFLVMQSQSESLPPVCRRSSKAFSHPLAHPHPSKRVVGACIPKPREVSLPSLQKSMNTQWSNNKEALWGHLPILPPSRLFLAHFEGLVCARLIRAIYGLQTTVACSFVSYLRVISTGSIKNHRLMWIFHSCRGSKRLAVDLLLALVFII